MESNYDFFRNGGSEPLSSRDSRLSFVRHDMRTPLAGIMSFAELLEDEISGPLNKEQKDYVATILRKCDELNAAIDHLR